MTISTLTLPNRIIKRGGVGIAMRFLIMLIFMANLASLANLNAVELKDVANCNGVSCVVDDSNYSEMTNYSVLNETIRFNNTKIGAFINYGTLYQSNTSPTITLNASTIDTLINYGRIEGRGISVNSNRLDNIINYGYMRNIGITDISTTINNLGLVSMSNTGYPFGHITNSNSNALIQNWTLKIDEDAGTFGRFDGNYTDESKTSHLTIYMQRNGSVSFKNSKSKIILDFGENFEFGREYNISKIATDINGNPFSALGVDFSRLITRSELYTLTKSGNNFIANLANAKEAGYSTIGNLHKSNIKTMNNLLLTSNKMIYPKYKKIFGESALKNQRVRYDLGASNAPAFDFDDKDENVFDSATFTFNASNDNSNATKQSAESSAENDTKPQIIKSPPTPKTITQSPYYFTLTPFVNHNHFFEGGRYNLSGFDFGLIAAFSGKLNEINTLGAHLGISHSDLKDSYYDEFNVTSANLMVGLHYKFDIASDSYIKARADFFSFLNKVQNTSIANELNPNAYGFGISVAYNKEWIFDDNGVLGIEVGIDYKGLKTASATTGNGGDSSISENYKSALYNMIYADLGLNYDKYFAASVGILGLDAGVGIKANITANKAKSKIILNGVRSIDMQVDNDLFLAYLSVGGSYLLERENFDMEFGLSYYGNYGDRTMSNGGSFELRVYW